MMWALAYAGRVKENEEEVKTPVKTKGTKRSLDKLLSTSKILENAMIQRFSP